MVKQRIWIILILGFSLTTFPKGLLAQAWEFEKEKDGIKIFTRKELNSSLKASKGEVTFKADLEKVNLLVGDAKNTEWWDKNISSIKVLNFERNKYIQYYIIYSVAWPLTNRDLALQASISTDPVTSVRTVIAKPLLNVVPEKEDLVRIKNTGKNGPFSPWLMGMFMLPSKALLIPQEMFHPGYLTCL